MGERMQARLISMGTDKRIEMGNRLSVKKWAKDGEKGKREIHRTMIGTHIQNRGQVQ